MMEAGPRYFVVAVCCALLNNAIMIGCDLAGIHYLPATAVSYVIVVVAGYGLHSRITFGQPMSLGAFIRYAAGMATNLPGWIALMFVLCDLAGLSVPIAAPVATAILFVWNFIISRWAIVGRPGLQKAA